MGTYHELPGSPKLTMDRKGGSGVRVFKVEWNEINTLLAECIPNPLNGYSVIARFPGAPWLVCERVDIEPFDPEGADGLDEPMSVYTKGGAKATVTYTVPEFDQAMNSTDAANNPGDGSGPGGEEGSTGKEHAYISHKISIGGEFLVVSNRGLEWANAHPKTGKKDVVGDVRAGIIVPMMEHQIIFPLVASPPWQYIRSLIGYVNETANVSKCPPETLLFHGLEANWQKDNTGQTGWNLEYRFSEKNVYAAAANAAGWNHFFRPDTGRFERLKTKAGADIFPKGNLRNVFPD